jgi:hypothetical protein
LSNEAAVLKLLSENNFTTFEHPFLLDYYQKEGITFLKQTSCKKDFNKMSMNLTDLHRDVLSEIHWQYRKEICISEHLKSLEQEIKAEFQTDNATCTLLLNGLSCLKGDLKFSRIKFILSHGDFNPWNCFSNGNKLFVFDWEMGKYRMPLWDYFNFIYHSVLLHVGDNQKKINNFLSVNQKWAISLMDDKATYATCQLMYLVEMLLHYMRQQKELSKIGLQNNVTLTLLVRYFSNILDGLLNNLLRNDNAKSNMQN